MNTLIEVLEQTVSLGREVVFSREVNQLKITVQEKDRTNTQFLPLHDHFTEFKVVECIKFQNTKIQEMP